MPMADVPKPKLTQSNRTKLPRSETEPVIQRRLIGVCQIPLRKGNLLKRREDELEWVAASQYGEKWPLLPSNGRKRF